MILVPYSGHRRDFRWHPGGTQAALRRHSGGTQATLRRHWGGTRAALRRHSGSTRAALGRHNCQDHNCRLNFQFISIHFIQDDDTWHPLHCSVTYNGLIGCLVASILGFRFHYEFRPLDQLTIRMQLQSSCRDIILMRVSECYTIACNYN